MKSINWKNSIGQIVLIFVGVTVATWFENWNNDLNSRKREIQFLRQMNVDLLHDLEDLNYNKESATRRLAHCNTIISELNSDRPYSDSLGRPFGELPIYSVFISNVGSYQTLKATGLDLIENDSLREKIVSLYEGRYSYAAQNGKIGHEFSLTIMMPSMTKNFTNVFIDVNGTGSTAIPVNYAALRKNNEFIEQVRLLASFQRIDISTNSSLIASIEELRSDVKAEISRLD